MDLIGLVVRGVEWLVGRWAREKEALRRARLIAEDVPRCIDLARRYASDQERGKQVLIEHDQALREILAQCDEAPIRELATLVEEIQRDYPRGITRRSDKEKDELLERVEAVRVRLGGEP